MASRLSSLDHDGTQAQVAFKVAVSRMVDQLELQEPNTYFEKHQFKEAYSQELYHLMYK